jgi:AAA family ATP:ADP antiporter
MMAAGVSFTVIRWLKTADNATDYSVMNTGRAMLWLPTSREEKYRAKQAMDTFVVRFGDVLASAVVFVSTALLHLGPSVLAALNAVAAIVWVFVAAAVARQNHAAEGHAAEPAAPLPVAAGAAA